MGSRGSYARLRWLGFAALFATGYPHATPQSLAAPNPARVDAARFDLTVKPVLAKTCAPCHGATVASGDLDLTPYLDPATLASGRPVWEKIAHRVEAGEMPPKGIPRPPQADLTAMVAFLRGEFGKADAATNPDPGRVVARRMNRNEYRNTIRDLLAVDFRADK